MTITKITTHSADAINRMLYQFKQSEKLQALHSANADQIQDLENAAYDFLFKININQATGAVLDRWGVVLNEQRLASNDADYRARLIYSITRYISSGTPEELITFFNLLMGTTHVQIYEAFPGVVNFAAVGASNPADPDLVKANIQKLCAAGVRVGWIIVSEDEHPFAFALHPNIDARGFDTYPVEEIGGKLVTVYI